MRHLRALPIVAFSLAGLTTVTAQAAEQNITLSNDRYLVEVAPTNGAIVRILDRLGNLELLSEPRLADNFKFSLPIRGETAWQSTEANYILGKDQKLTAHEATGTKLTLKWAGPLTSVLTKSFEASAGMTIELSGEDIRFTFAIDNATPLEIGEVYYPILGGCMGLGDTPAIRKQTELVLPGPTELRRANIFHSFANMSWLGVLGAEQYYAYPDTLSMPWMELHQPENGRSVYFGAHDPVARYKVIHLEMSPGTSGPRAEGNWPRPDELNGLPAGVKMCFVHFPYQPAGQRFEATPAVLRFHHTHRERGTGAKVYGEWLRTQADFAEPARDWLSDAQVIQQVGGVPFKDWPDWARQASNAGVKALLANDWKVGGHADGVPRFEPNPTFGTPESFAQALRACQQLGVKVAVRINLQPVSQLDEGYRAKLQPYASMDRWGIEHTLLGWFDNSTLTGGFGAGERRVYVNPGHPGLRKALVAQLRQLATLGVDGVHLQDFFGRPLDFNPTTGRTADRASWEGGIECVREILRACREVRPDFAVSTDMAWDRLAAVARVCSVEAREGCALRMACPGWQSTFTVSDEDSMNAINDAVRFRGQLRIALAGGKPVGDADLTGIAGYLRAVLAAREILRDALMDGEMVAAPDLHVGKPILTSAFRGTSSGQPTLVLANPSVDAATFTLALEQKPYVLWQPATGARRIDGITQISIPGRQIAILTDAAALDRLAHVPPWQAPVRDERVIFDMASSEDVREWSITGGFAVSPIGTLCPRATLNSLAKAGETATGSALSPPFKIQPPSSRMEIILHGGTSEKINNQENLVLRLIDAETGTVLEDILPPSTHELTTRKVPLDKLQGKTIRLKLVDNNTNGSFAWIGLKRVALIGPPASQPN